MNKLMLSLKVFALVLVECMLFGCVRDVSDKYPHENMVGTTWELKTDAYVVEYRNNDWGLLVVPCVAECTTYIPGMEWEYNAMNIGRVDASSQIIAGMKKGQRFKVLRVMTKSNFEMGSVYWPIATTIDDNGRTASDEINAFLLYRKYYDAGILNPKYAERVGGRSLRRVSP